MLEEAGRTTSTDGDFVEFAHAGAAAKGEFHCSACGYGVSVNAFLPQCPMCAGTVWEPAMWARPDQRYQA
jgi:rubredoxin